MSRVIDLELPTKYFVKDRDNKLEARIARFKLEKGDILRFYEIDDIGKRTGKYFDRKVIDLHKIHKATCFWKKKDLLQYGLYIFQLGKL
jgi:hypothetical protein